MIRLATRQDIPNIVEMIRQGSKEMTIDGLRDVSHHNEEYIKNLLFNIVIGKGFILLDDAFKGMLIATISPNIWCKDVLELRQLGWWVCPEYRTGTLSGRLWIAFNKKAQELLDCGRVKVVYSSYRNNGKEVDFTKYGFKPLENIFYRE